MATLNGNATFTPYRAGDYRYMTVTQALTIALLLIDLAVDQAVENDDHADYQAELRECRKTLNGLKTALNPP